MLYGYSLLGEIIRLLKKNKIKIIYISTGKQVCFYIKISVVMGVSDLSDVSLFSTDILTEEKLP